MRSAEDKRALPRAILISAGAAIVALAGCGSTSTSTTVEELVSSADAVVNERPSAGEVVDQSATSTTASLPLPEPPALAALPVPDGIYGDFSGQTWTMLDPYELTERVVTCMQDHGWAVEIIPPGTGVSYESVPKELRGPASAQSDECRRSMSVPSFSPPSSEELKIVYEYNLALNECLAKRGFSVTPAPSFEQFEETYLTGPWTAYYGSDVAPTDLETEYACPLVPAGGLGAWQIGDPIEPLPDR